MLYRQRVAFFRQCRILHFPPLLFLLLFNPDLKVQLTPRFLHIAQTRCPYKYTACIINYVSCI